MFLLILPDVATDDSLLALLRRGERDAVIAAYEAYFAPLYQYTRLKVGDAALAEDIVSDVFVALLQSLGKASAPHSNLRAWLFRVARNQIAQHYDKVKQFTETELEEWMPAPVSDNPAAGLDDLFEIERVRHALRMLNADHQEILIIRFGQRLSLQEAADIMGRSVGAIKQLQFRALETLRSILIDPQAQMEGSDG